MVMTAVRQARRERREARRRALEEKVCSVVKTYKEAYGRREGRWMDRSGLYWYLMCLLHCMARDGRKRKKSGRNRND